MNNTPKLTPVVVDTLDRFIEHGYELKVYCQNVCCLHQMKMDLHKLHKQFGGSQSCLHKHLAPKLKCVVCNGKDLQFTVLPYGPDGPRHPSALPKRD